MGIKVYVIDDRIGFYCPGCKTAHFVNQTWTYNGNREEPTFSPSILVSSHIPERGDKPGEVRTTCHSFITCGRIRFLNDCRHDLAGETVDLPDWELPSNHWADCFDPSAQV